MLEIVDFRSGQLFKVGLHFRIVENHLGFIAVAGEFFVGTIRSNNAGQGGVFFGERDDFQSVARDGRVVHLLGRMLELTVQFIEFRDQ